jgi:hypothetical protein
MSNDFSKNPESGFIDGDKSSVSNATESLNSFFESYLGTTNSDIRLRILKENVFEKVDAKLDKLIIKYENNIHAEKLAMRLAIGLPITKVAYEIALAFFGDNYYKIDSVGDALMIIVPGVVVAGMGMYYGRKKLDIQDTIDKSLGVVQWLNEKSKRNAKNLKEG